MDVARFASSLLEGVRVAYYLRSALLDYARAGDTVIVTAIDRLGRSVPDHRVVQLGNDHRRHQPDPIGPGRYAPSSVRLSGLANAMRSPQHSDENGPSSTAFAHLLSIGASRSGSITGIVIPTCTTAILARDGDAADRFSARGNIGSWQSTLIRSRTSGSP